MSRMMGFKGRACIGPGWRKMCEPKDGKGFGPDFERLLQLDFRHATQSAARASTNPAPAPVAYTKTAPISARWA